MLNERAYALVLARGGSKGLPGKNLMTLRGHPLIAWSIAAARAAASIQKIICSTDCERIAEVARSYGAETPFIRPAKLASDLSTDLDVFSHAIEFLEEANDVPSLLVQLRPTAPFRDPLWIDKSVALMNSDHNISCVRSVAVADHSPYKMWTMSEDACQLHPLLKITGVAEPYNLPRQSLPSVYRHTGQLDVIRSSTIKMGSMTGPIIAPLVVDQRAAVDIDALRDFQFAELIFDEAMPSVIKKVIDSL